MALLLLLGLYAPSHYQRRLNTLKKRLYTPQILKNYQKALIEDLLK
jgi:hypothetical protein